VEEADVLSLSHTHGKMLFGSLKVDLTYVKD